MRSLVFLALGLLLAPIAESRAEYRSLDGTGNNIAHPEWGAPFSTFTRFRYSSRLGLPDYAYTDGLSEPARPDNLSARAISNLVHRETEFRYSSQNLSDILATWLFLVHIDSSLGLAMSVITQDPPIFQIPVAPDDPFFGCNAGGEADAAHPCLSFLPLSEELNTTLPPFGGTFPKEQINILNPWLDASFVYGSNPIVADSIRTKEGGKLRSKHNAEGEEFPLTVREVMEIYESQTGQPMPPGTFVSRNPGVDFAFGIGVSPSVSFIVGVQILLLREHNRLAAELQSLGVGARRVLGIPDPGVDPVGYDETIYQLARKALIAEYEAIIFNEMLPALGIAMPPYPGYDPRRRVQIWNEFSAAAFRIGDTLSNKHTFEVDERGSITGRIPVVDGIGDPNPPFAQLPSKGLDSFLRGQLFQPAAEFDVEIIDELRDGLFFFPNFTLGQDLIASQIMRGRVRGLHDFNTIRRVVGLEPYADFSELTVDAELRQRLTEAFPGGIATLDPWTGMHAEDPEVGAVFGRTLNVIWRIQMENLRSSDRFWYQNELKNDLSFRRLMEALGFKVKRPNDCKTEVCEVLDVTFAEMILNNTRIGEGGFPLQRNHNAFLVVR